MQEFIAWVTIALLWLFVTLGIANFYPLIDGGITKIWIVLKDKRARSKAMLHGDASSPSDQDSLDQAVAVPKHG